MPRNWARLLFIRVVRHLLSWVLEARDLRPCKSPTQLLLEVREFDLHPFVNVSLPVLLSASPCWDHLIHRSGGVSYSLCWADVFADRSLDNFKALMRKLTLAHTRVTVSTLAPPYLINIRFLFSVFEVFLLDELLSPRLRFGLRSVVARL